jgi:hypothetical protein
MSRLGIVTMIGVLGVVWGGFIVALVTAVRCERRRSRSETTPDGPGDGSSNRRTNEVR